MPDPILLLFRYMHILGAITLMGGTIFMRFGLAPVVAGLDEKVRTDIHDKVRARWSRFVMLAAGLLLVSGVANMIMFSSRYYNIEPLLGMSYGMIVGIKFLLALPIFFFASLLAGRSPTAKKFQANAVTWMNVNLALALVMVLIGGALKFVKREPKKAENGAIVVPVEAIASQTLSFKLRRE